MKIEYDKYQYHSEHILIRKFHDSIDIQDITDSWDYLIQNNMLNHTHKGVINDIRDADLNMNIYSFNTLLNFLKANELFHELKLAVVCDTPGKIIFPILGDSLNTDLNIKPFSTTEAAAEWILA